MTQLNRKQAPEIFAMGHLEMPRITTEVLSNGIHLHSVDRGEDNVNRLTVVVPGGNAESPSPEIGQLAAETCLDGTLNHSGEEIADLLDFNGAWTRGNVSVHHHSLVNFSLNSRMDSVLPLIIDLTLNPAFSRHEIEVAREKGARRLELSMEKVNWHAERALQQLVMGPECLIARTPTPDGIRAVTSEQLLDWHKATFQPQQTHVFLCGRITPEIHQTVAKAFGEIASTDARPERAPVVFTPNPTERLIKIERPGSLQTAVNCGIPAIGRNHPDYEMLRLVVTMLGGYFGSRLMLNIREDKGFTYGISAGLLGYRRNSYINITTECDNRYTEPLLGEIRSEIERMHRPETYTPAELERARSFVTTQLAAQLDSPFAVMDYYINMLTTDTPSDYFARQQRTLTEMTPEILAETARKYLRTEMLYTALAGHF